MQAVVSINLFGLNHWNEELVEQRLILRLQAPNFVWKTTDFPAARKGYLWCIIMQVLLGELADISLSPLTARLQEILL